jgi:asparagine synthase (glutamine-hydrolysing)
MCGICGLIHFDQISKNDEKLVGKLNDALAHRGPDAGVLYSDENIVFGHRRLSIIDLSEEANQPFHSADGMTSIVFNGEIFNAQALRAELESKYTFKTDHSDTEVIVYAYREWGINFINKLNGMFAIVIYDKTNKKTYLVRDRIGEKPLYYFQKDKALYFSSEVSPFFESGLIEKKIREEAVYHYLTFLTTPAPGTFFEGVNKLEAGHYMEFGVDYSHTTKYWDIADYLNDPLDITFDQAVDETEQLLQQAMTYRYIADVPVSNAISGGLDSSLNVYYSSRTNPDISAINVSYAVKSQFDESDVAKKFCEEMGVEFLNKQIDDEDFRNLIFEYLSIQKDLPLGDPNVSLVYYLSKLARDNFSAKVLMVGEGGDEIGGYPKYTNHVKIAKYMDALPEFAHKMIQSLSIDKLNKFDLQYKGQAMSRSHVHGFTEAQKKRFWKKSKGYNSFAVLKDYMDQVTVKTDDSFLRKVINLEYKLRLPEMILSRIDYPSMAANVEARSPFVDHDLVAYSARLPFALKMRNGQAKSILKAIGKKVLPDYVINHPKVGFGQLLTPFFEETLPSWFKKEILDERSPIENYVEAKFLNQIYQRHLHSKKEGFKLWILYALHRWLLINDVSFQLEVKK